MRLAYRDLSTDRLLLRRPTRSEEGSEYSWIVELSASGCVIGVVSAWLEDDAVELGFVLARAYWNRGLTTEAVLAVKKWALHSEAVSRVWATCDVENRGSARVLEKAGLRNCGLFPREIVRPNLGPAPRPSLLFEKQRSAV
jgi:RimJ/RimL family protein N-acetyltransferase